MSRLRTGCIHNSSPAQSHRLQLWTSNSTESNFTTIAAGKAVRCSYCMVAQASTTTGGTFNLLRRLALNHSLHTGGDTDAHSSRPNQSVLASSKRKHHFARTSIGFQCLVDLRPDGDCLHYRIAILPFSLRICWRPNGRIHLRRRHWSLGTSVRVADALPDTNTSIEPKLELDGLCCWWMRTYVRWNRGGCSLHDRKRIHT